MSSTNSRRRSWCVRAFPLLLWLVCPSLAAAQTSAPWTGAIGREAFSHAIAHEHSMSADGRIQVFETDAPLVADDTNGILDVYLRDSVTGLAMRVSVGTGPLSGPGAPQGNQPSDFGSVSSDGRHVVFQTRNSFDETDTNGALDLYVRDMWTGITSLVTVGPNGQRLDTNSSPFPVGRLNGDGRFIVFTGDFRFAGGSFLWIRDRDTDGNGSYDDTGTVTTTAIDVRSVGSDLTGQIENVAISRDGRYVAFVAGAVDEAYQWLGTRLYLHDRQLGTTIRVDRPLPSSGDVVAQAFSPDLSDNGLVVYTSTAPNLVAGDGDASPDVFVYDIASGSQERLLLTHGNFNLLEAYGTVISSDGRYVAFTGFEQDSDGSQRWSVFAFDRAAHTSHDVSLLLDGSRDPEALAAGMSADGLQIAYWSGSPDVIYEAPLVWGIYVATSVGLSPEEITARTDGDRLPIEVTVPDGVSWTARLVSDETRYSYTEYSTYRGTGPATIEVEIPYNQTGVTQTYKVWLGSKSVTIRQPVTPVIAWMNPDIASAAGGETFEIFGFNFQPGATVMFGDVPATDVTVAVGEFDATISGIVPAHQSGPYPVVVRNPDGEVSSEEVSFYFYDETPPVVTANISGMLGANGWYTSDVAIDWTVEDPESAIVENTCTPVTQSTDVAWRTIDCYAVNSEGWSTSSRVELKRDATAPLVAIASPQGGDYLQHQSVAVDFDCTDATSGIASCNANQSGTLDTSTPGAFSFVVSAIDHAGNVTTRSVAYTVKALSSLDAFNASGSYGGSATLNATLFTADGPLANRVVTFFVAGAAVATATTDANGRASAPIALAGRAAGSYSLRAEYAGDATSSNAVSNTASLTVMPGTLRVTAVNATKVYGEALPAFSVFFEGFVSGDSVASLGGTLSFATTATSFSAPGQYAVTPSGYTSTNYAITFVPGQLTVTKAQTSASMSSTPNPSRPNQLVQLTAAIAAQAPGSGTPTGSVLFHDQDGLIGSAPLVNGVATLPVKLKRGTYLLTATYAGDVNFTGATASATHRTN